jgi:hypothetical protein
MKLFKTKSGLYVVGAALAGVVVFIANQAINSGSSAGQVVTKVVQTLTNAVGDVLKVVLISAGIGAVLMLTGVVTVPVAILVSLGAGIVAAYVTDQTNNWVLNNVRGSTGAPGSVDLSTGATPPQSTMPSAGAP